MVYRLVQNAKLALQRKHTNHQFISVYIKDFDNKLKALDCKTNHWSHIFIYNCFTRDLSALLVQASAIQQKKTYQCLL